MRVMKSKITLLSLAVSGLFAASAAHAVVDLTANTGQATYAKELNANTNLTLATDFAANVQFGFGVTAGDTRFIRLDLTGATFQNAGGLGALTVTGGTCAAMGTPTIVSGGGAGTNFVIYQFTAAASCAPTDLANFAMGAALTLTSTSSNPTIKYALYETGAGASQQSTTQLLGNTVTRDLLKLATSYTFTWAGAVTEVAAATTLFTKFCANGTVMFQPGTAGCSSTSTDVDAIIGQLNSFNFVANKKADGTAIAALTDIMTTATKIDVTGDFSASAGAMTGVYLSGTAGCDPATVLATTTAVTATGASLSGANVIAGMGNDGRYLCYKVTGSTNIPASIYSAKLTPTSVTGYTVTGIDAGQVGTIVRDGVELQSPWFSTNSTQYVTRFFFTNTGSSAASCTVTAFGETGNTLTTGTAVSGGISIPANGQLAVLATDVVSAGSAAGRAAVRFICAAPSANIQGTYVITHLANGSVANTPLLRPGTN